RCAQAVAVGEQDQRYAAVRNLEDERRVRVRDAAELPDELLAVVELHEPAEARRHRYAVAPARRCEGCVERVRQQERRMVIVVRWSERRVELREIHRRRDEPVRRTYRSRLKVQVSGRALLRVDAIWHGHAAEYLAITI